MFAPRLLAIPGSSHQAFTEKEAPLGVFLDGYAAAGFLFH